MSKALLFFFKRTRCIQSNKRNSLHMIYGMYCRIKLMQISWWRHQMETFSRNWPFVWGIHRSPVNSPHKDQWRGALMFSLICVWINGWVNNREAGDLRRYHAHYDVTVMLMAIFLVYSTSGITFGKKSLSRAQNGGHFENFETLNTASIWRQIWKDRPNLCKNSFLWWWRHRLRHRVASKFLFIFMFRRGWLREQIATATTRQ